MKRLRKRLSRTESSRRRSSALRVRGGRLLRIESLPARRVLAAVTGEVFVDADLSTHRSDGEVAAIQRVIFVDANDDGVLQNGESLAIADENGQYGLTVPDGQLSAVALFNGASTQRQTSPVDGVKTSSIDGLVDVRESIAGNVAVDLDTLVVPDAAGTAAARIDLTATGSDLHDLGGDQYVLAVDRGSTNLAVVDATSESVQFVSAIAGTPRIEGLDLNPAGVGLALTGPVGGILTIHTIDLSTPTAPVAAATSTTAMPGASLIGDGIGNTSVLVRPSQSGLGVELLSHLDGSVITSATLSRDLVAETYDSESGLLVLRDNSGTTVVDVNNNFDLLYTVDNMTGPVAIDAARDRLLIATASDAIAVVDLDDGVVAGIVRLDSPVVAPVDIRVAGDGSSIELVGRSELAVVDLSAVRSHQIIAVGPAAANSPGFNFGVAIEPGNSPPVFDGLRQINVFEDDDVVVPAGLFLGDSEDPNGDEFIVLVRSDAEFGTLDVTIDGEVSYVPNADYFGQDSFTIWLHDGQDPTDEIVILLNVIGVADPPIGLDPMIDPVLEDFPIGDPFGFVPVLDADGFDHTFTVDDDRFEVNDLGEFILVGGPLNFETEPLIPITITATDNETGDVVSAQTTIEVLDANDPITAISPPTARVNENVAGAFVTELEVADEDLPNQLIVLSVDDDRFVIEQNDLRLADGVSLDFEATPTVVVTVTATEFVDGQAAGTFEQAITISVDDAFEQPGGLTLSDNLITALTPGDVVGDILIDGAAPDQRFEFMVDTSPFVFEAATLRLPEGQFIADGGLQILVTVSAVDTQGEFLTIEEDFLIDVIANEYPAHNLDNPYDANHDGELAPLDALVIINYLRANGPTAVGEGPLDFCYDVNGDGLITPLDALLVINQLNRSSLLASSGGGQNDNGGNGGEAEGEGEFIPGGLSVSVDSGVIAGSNQPTAAAEPLVIAVDNDEDDEERESLDVVFAELSLIRV